MVSSHSDYDRHLDTVKAECQAKLDSTFGESVVQISLDMHMMRDQTRIILLHSSGLETICALDRYKLEMTSKTGIKDLIFHEMASGVSNMAVELFKRNPEPKAFSRRRSSGPSYPLSPTRQMDYDDFDDKLRYSPELGRYDIEDPEGHLSEKRKTKTRKPKPEPREEIEEFATW